MKMEDCESFEVEQGLTRLEKEGRVWKYELLLSDVSAIHNLTVLFRGDEEEILSCLEYGALLINGICVDTLQQASYSKDPRVKEFSHFTGINFLPAFEFQAHVYLIFRHNHLYAEDRIRVVADVIPGREMIPETFEYSTKLCRLYYDGAFHVDGLEWSIDFAGALIDDEVDAQITLGSVCESESDEEVLTAHTLNDRLNDIVAWRAQRMLLRNALSSDTVHEGDDEKK